MWTGSGTVNRSRLRQREFSAALVVFVRWRGSGSRKRPSQTSQRRGVLFLLFGAVACVLLMACANAANPFPVAGPVAHERVRDSRRRLGGAGEAAPAAPDRMGGHLGSRGDSRAGPRARSWSPRRLPSPARSRDCAFFASRAISVSGWTTRSRSLLWRWRQRAPRTVPPVKTHPDRPGVTGVRNASRM